MYVVFEGGLFYVNSSQYIFKVSQKSNFQCIKNIKLYIN